MCIIVRKEPKRIIPYKWFDEFWTNNSDGFGCCYWSKGDLLVFKTLNKIKAWDFISNQLKGKKAILHFRMATHGARTIRECHPFELVRGMWLIHNGIIHDTLEGEDKSASDTMNFAEYVVKPLLDKAVNPGEFVRDPAFQFLVESHLGNSNRIVICDRQGPVFYNTKIWHVIKSDDKDMNGCFVSNTYAWSDPTVTWGKNKWSGKTVSAPTTNNGKWSGKTQTYYNGEYYNTVYGRKPVVGDYVKCINVKEASPALSWGKVYKVVGLLNSESGNADALVLTLEGVEMGYMASRFLLVEKDKSIPPLNKAPLSAATSPVGLLPAPSDNAGQGTATLPATNIPTPAGEGIASAGNAQSMEDWEAELEALQHNLDIQNEDNIEIEAHMPNGDATFTQLTEMEYNDLLDWLQDYPVAAVDKLWDYLHNYEVA